MSQQSIPSTILMVQNDKAVNAGTINNGNINYNVKNPLSKLMHVMEGASFFAEHYNYYLSDSLQYLFPFSNIEMYGPSGKDQNILNPGEQDNKTDFQKQNIKDFTLTGTYFIRGWISVNNQVRPFLKLSYTGGPDSRLSTVANGKLSDHILCYVKIQGNGSNGLLKVPYNTDTDCYELELWSYEGNDLYNHLGDKGKTALQNGSLQVRNDLIRGQKADFTREGLDDKNMYEVSADNTMHPINPLKIEVAWGDHTKQYWDNNNGKNYHYQFNMILRGWDNFLQVGVSGNPHGGIGFLHYRNLLSNYKPYSQTGELSRVVMPWMFDVNGKKNEQVKEEKSLAVEYVDLHVLKNDCGIGIHRHRDNQEVFFLMTGKAFMMVGDWYQFADRERAFEVRTLLPGSFALLKAGQLHALINAVDTDSALLMFGGYD